MTIAIKSSKGDGDTSVKEKDLNCLHFGGHSIFIGMYSELFVSKDSKARV